MLNNWSGMNLKKAIDYIRRSMVSFVKESKKLFPALVENTMR